MAEKREPDWSGEDEVLFQPVNVATATPVGRDLVAVMFGFVLSRENIGKVEQISKLVLSREVAAAVVDMLDQALKAPRPKEATVEVNEENPS